MKGHRYSGHNCSLFTYDCEFESLDEKGNNKDGKQLRKHRSWTIVHKLVHNLCLSVKMISLNFLVNRYFSGLHDCLLPQVHQGDEGHWALGHLRDELPCVPLGRNRALVWNHQPGKILVVGCYRWLCHFGKVLKPNKEHVYNGFVYTWIENINQMPKNLIESKDLPDWVKLSRNPLWTFSDSLWHSSEALRLPKHFQEELHNSEVRRQDHECLVWLYHLPLLGRRDHQSQTRVAHRIHLLDSDSLHCNQVCLGQGAFW